MAERDRGFAPTGPATRILQKASIWEIFFLATQRRALVYKGISMRAFLILLLAFLPLSAQKRVPPKPPSQTQDGFGINSDLPRDPYLPWDRRWWTRMFDAGVSWIRIGQYENTSDYTDRKSTRLNSSHLVI